MKRRGNVISPIDSISTVVEMLQQTDYTVEDGETCWVRATQAMYVFRLNSGLVPDGVNVIASLYSSGVWQKLNVGAVGPGSSLGPFNTVATGAVGSGRLLDVTAAQIAGLTNGQSAWVISVRDVWRWDPASTQAADNITICNPTANGVNPGRFVRQEIPDPSWMAQLTWVIDPANGVANDENSGATALLPLKSDAERQRRMGIFPLWNGGDATYSSPTAYHLRYISDVLVSDPVRIQGMRGRNANVFLHGSMTDGQGQSTLYSGAITALDALDNTTAGATRSWQLTSAGIPVSWTASALINQRVRLTSGASVGAKSFAIFDLTGKKARCCEFLAANSYVFNYNQSNVHAPPSNGDNFVVERLTSIPSFLWTLGDADDGALNFNFYQGCVESLSLGIFGGTTAINGDCVVSPDSDYFTQFDGVRAVWFGAGIGGVINWSTCAILGFNQTGNWSQLALHGGYTNSLFNWGLGSRGIYMTVADNWMAELTGIGAGVAVIQCFAQIFDFAIFDCTVGRMLVFAGNGVSFLGKYWGTGNTGQALSFFPGTQANFNGNFQANLSTTANPQISFDRPGGSLVTAVPAFDTGTNTYTASRNTTFTNLFGTVAGGGFGNSMSDPVSQSAFVKS
jgi:hypothetical protein